MSLGLWLLELHCVCFVLETMQVIEGEKRNAKLFITCFENVDPYQSALTLSQNDNLSSDFLTVISEFWERKKKKI